MGYHEFIDGKRMRHKDCGFHVSDSEINPMAKPFQRDIIQWGARRGTAAYFADCGMGKTFMQLEYARLVAHKMRGQVLLACPLAVAEQTIREARKFGIDASIGVVREMGDCIHDINVTNYERLDRFDPSKFVAGVLDESSILKGYTSKTKRLLCNMFAGHRYKLACTATPAPNDHMELGNHSEFLGVMPSSEMLSRWFINDGKETGTYRLKGPGRADFWDWCASWAVAISKPSDIGHDDAGYDLPPMTVHEHLADDNDWWGNASKKLSATDVYSSKAKTLQDRCRVVADLVNGDNEYWAVWCDTNAEADLLKRLIPDAVEVRGSEAPEAKAEKLERFSVGNVRVMITKSEIGGFGLNWQHCHKTTFFASYSFERWYQAVRRLWRFGQLHPVDVHMVMSHEEHGLAQTLKRKQSDFEAMSREMSLAMKEGMRRSLYGSTPLRTYQPSTAMALPQWMKGGRT